MKLALVQTDLVWENPTANLATIEEQIAAIDQSVDLIVLPELFTSGFSMNPALVAEPMNSTTFKWMKMMAAQTGAVVAGSYAVKERGQFFNRLVWMQPDGTFDYYDKCHLFRMSGEDAVYSPGNRKIVQQIKGFKIMPLICYDLRFPVWSRNRNLEYDLLLYVANWPATRSGIWKTLLAARAIENQCFAVGVNRIGTDGNGVAHAGNSTIIDYKGEVISDAQAAASVHVQELHRDQLSHFRQIFPAYLDADTFTLDK